MMKRINNILKLSVFFLLFAAVMSCGKDAAEGPVGPAGQNGEKGDKGDQGAKGADGTLLRYGSGAPASTLGNENDFYIDVKNSNFYGPKTGNSWGTATSLKGAAGSTGATGATGAKGADGSQFLSGTAAPTTQGKVGDFYFRTTTATLYGPKISTGWGAGISLKGAKGDKGDDGNANIITIGWTIVTKEYWKNLHGYSSGANRWLSFDRPGDKALRVVEDVFIANGNNLSGAILVYANNGTGSRMLPFEDRLEKSGHTGTLEHRFLFRNNRIYIVVALRDGTWDIDYIMNIYLPSIQWKVVLIPEMVAKTHADALSELNLNNYDAVAKHFGLKQ